MRLTHSTILVGAIEVITDAVHRAKLHRHLDIEEAHRGWVSLELQYVTLDHCLKLLYELRLLFLL